MRKRSLNGEFERRELHETEYKKAKVPGSILSDMKAAGELPDPFYRDNEKYALEAMKKEYEYRCLFSLSAEECRTEEILLHFDGLDTLADITLNKEKIASTNNMHRIYDFSVSKILHVGENELSIVFHSPTEAIAKAYAADPVDGTEDAMKGFVHLRKAHYMFGWDWGPRIPDAGIWRSCSLLFVEKARITDVKIHQEHVRTVQGTDVSLSFEMLIQRANQKEEEPLSKNTVGLTERFTVKSPNGEVLFVSDGKKPITIKSAELWWPNEAGEQPLYTISTELFSAGGELCDEREYRIGLRTMEMNTAKDEYGSRFAHVVNGVELFAMGADYIPEDNLISGMNRERTYQLLSQCKAAHFNCIRVWGGGFYPGDDFFDICDELGLMVWQDFMFACGHYRFTKAFEENVSAELVDNIRRIRHHACLGLFCGNNEMEMFTQSRTWNGTDALAADYLRMYEDVFKKITKKEAPDIFYWPASPSSGGHFDEPNDENRGDVHYWEVWHGNRPFTEYRKFYFRYLSEFGFQSFPSVKTIEAFTEPEDRNIFSYVFEKHQRNAAANGKILGYLEQMYLYPTSLENLVYASQLLQAEAIRYGVEHFRRNRGRCMGAVYWQLNDCWPVASWSSIDYYMRWKALHYYAKRFFAPLLLSCEEQGMLGQCSNVNAENTEVEKSFRLCVTNDLPEDQKVLVTWQLRDKNAEILSENSEEILVPKRTAKWLEKVSLPELLVYEQYISYQLHTEAFESSGTVLFCAPKHFKFQNPHLSVFVEGDVLVISAESFAKNVLIQNEKDDLLLEDNYFDLNKEEKRIHIVCGEVKSVTAKSVYDIR